MLPPLHLRSGQYGCVVLLIAERKDGPIYAEYHDTADASAAYDGDVRAGKFI